MRPFAVVGPDPFPEEWVTQHRCDMCFTCRQRRRTEESPAEDPVYSSVSEDCSDPGSENTDDDNALELHPKRRKTSHPPARAATGEAVATKTQRTMPVFTGRRLGGVRRAAAVPSTDVTQAVSASLRAQLMRTPAGSGAGTKPPTTPAGAASAAGQEASGKRARESTGASARDAESYCQECGASFGRDGQRGRKLCVRCARTT